MKKFLIFLIPALLLSAGCDVFSKGGSSGLSKTINGGVDWILANKQDGGSGSMQAANISKLEIDPNNRENIYAGSYNGGLFLSTDSGGTWKNILSNSTVFDFAVNMANPKIIYAAGDIGGLGRVVKTSDGGKSWLKAYNESTPNNPVRNIALNPSNPEHLVIGTDSGTVIKSTDGGLNWQLLKNFSNKINRIYWTNSGVYVLVREKGLFKGSGVGDDFTDLTSGLRSEGLLNQFSKTGSVKIFNQAYVDPLTSNLLYITTDIGLFKSTDLGKNWIAVKLPVKQEALHARPIVVAKQNSNTVLTAIGSIVYKSTDGGNSFQTQNVPFVNAFVNYIVMDPVLPQIMFVGGYVNTNN
jgi:photosystem II stability/assembly factor-like uncharacterized protein